MARISWGVGWSGRDSLNLAAMRTRRSLAVMSAVAGAVLVLYQGAAARRSSMSAGAGPAGAYQGAAMGWAAGWGGLGAAARRSSMSAGSWPAVAYQVTAMAWQASCGGLQRPGADFGGQARQA